jgi:hypothetical protein
MVDRNVFIYIDRGCEGADRFRIEDFVSSLRPRRRVSRFDDLLIEKALSGVPHEILKIDLR